jgi:hypothetical protein
VQTRLLASLIEDRWLLQYIRKKLVAGLEHDETVFVQEQYLDELDGMAYTGILYTMDNLYMPGLCIASYSSHS